MHRRAPSYWTVDAIFAVNMLLLSVILNWQKWLILIAESVTLILTLIIAP